MWKHSANREENEVLGNQTSYSANHEGMNAGGWKTRFLVFALSDGVFIAGGIHAGFI